MKISRVIISITLPIFLIMLFASLLTTKQYLLVSEGLYESHDDITFDHEYVSDRVMGYLNYRYDSLDIGPREGEEDLFRPIELRHMKDVKDLYTMLRLVAIGSLFVAVSLSYIMYRKDKGNFFKTYKRLYYGPMFFIIVLGSYILIDFNGIFRLFHELFFTNDEWRLYSTDALIQLLPTNFWMVSAGIILLLFALSLALINRIFLKIERKQST